MTASYPDDIKTFTPIVDGDDAVAAQMNTAYEEITAIETALGTNPEGTSTDLTTRLARVVSGSGLLQFEAASTLTIASGVITVTKNVHRVDTESSAASDDLVTITAGADHQVLFLRINNSGRTVTIKHGTGNIYCSGGQDVTLGHTYDTAILWYDDTLDQWLCIPGSFGMQANTLTLSTANTWTAENTFTSIRTAITQTPLTTNTTLDATYSTVLVNCTSGAITITLPTAVGIAGRIYRIKKTDSSGNAVTIDGNSSQTIDGALTKTLSTQYASAAIQSDGANWMVI